MRYCLRHSWIENLLEEVEGYSHTDEAGSPCAVVVLHGFGDRWESRDFRSVV